MYKKIISFLIVIVIFTPFFSSFCQAREIAIVVNIANPIENLSLKDLTKIFKQEKQYWDGEKIHILMREEGSWEKEIILKKVYEMSDEELKKFWLGKIFRGEIASFLLVFGSTNMVQKLIRQTPGAISLIDASSIGEGIKVIKIEGKLPQDEGYILRE